MSVARLGCAQLRRHSESRTYPSSLDRWRGVDVGPATQPDAYLVLLGGLHIHCDLHHVVRLQLGDDADGVEVQPAKRSE